MFIGKTIGILLCNSMPNKKQSIKKTCLLLHSILVFIEKVGSRKRFRKEILLQLIFNSYFYCFYIMHLRSTLRLIN